MLFEGIQNSDIFTANESQPFALKRYIAKRLNGAGIEIDSKKTFNKKKAGLGISSKSFYENDLYSSMGFKTKIKAPTYQSTSSIGIELKIQGKTLTISYDLYNQKVNVKMDVSHANVNDIVNKIIKNFKPAKEKLIEIHSKKKKFREDNPKEAGVYGGSHPSEEKINGREVANSFDYPNVSVKFSNGSINRWDSNITSESKFYFDVENIPFDDSRRLKVSFIVKMMKDPTIKRMMDKDDKLDKNFSLSYATYSTMQEIANNKEIKKVIMALYEHIKVSGKFIIMNGGISNNSRPYISVRPVNDVFFDIKTEKNSKQKSKQHISKVKIYKSIVNIANTKKRWAEEEMTKYEQRAIKYGHLLIKRFFTNPERYI